LHGASGELAWSGQLRAILEAPAGYQPRREEVFSHYAPEWRARITELVDACMSEGEPFDEEMQVITFAGRRAWVRTLGEPLREGSGELAGVQGAIQELAPRELPAGTLLGQTLGGALGGGEAFVTVDREGRLNYVNEAAERLFGRTAREMIG